MIKAGQQISVMIPDYAEIDVKRPNGVVETVRYAAGNKINPALFATMKKATMSAGKGEVLTYRNVEKQSCYVVTTADEMHAHHDAVVDAMTLGGTSK